VYPVRVLWQKLADTYLSWLYKHRQRLYLNNMKVKVKEVKITVKRLQFKCQFLQHFTLCSLCGSYCILVDKEDCYFIRGKSKFFFCGGVVMFCLLLPHSSSYTCGWTAEMTWLVISPLQQEWKEKSSMPASEQCTTNNCACDLSSWKPLCALFCNFTLVTLLIHT